MSTSKFLVVDNLLSSSIFDKLNHEIDSREFANSSSDLWQGTFQEKEVLVSNPIIWTQNKDAIDLIKESKFISVYPTKTVFDKLISRIVDISIDTGIVGQHEVDWLAISMSIYKANERHFLSWHNDNAEYSGAFVFYLHKSWDLRLGGELLIKDLMSSDVGTFLHPIPNRLVIIRGGTPHCVNLIRGPRSERITFAGFFLKRSAAERKLDQLRQLQT